MISSQRTVMSSCVAVCRSGFMSTAKCKPKECAIAAASSCGFISAECPEIGKLTISPGLFLIRSAKVLRKIIDEGQFHFKVAVASHDERNAKSSGNYYRIPRGAGGPVDLGESSPAASIAFYAGKRSG